MTYLTNHVGLFTDQYELTMAQAHFLQGRQDIEATFDYFFRKTPFGSSFVILAGVRDVLESLEKFRYDAEDLEYLHSLGFHDDFLEYLRDFRFQGDIHGPDEGELVFPDTPVLRVKGNIIEAQLIETLVLNILNFQSLIATKAARLRQAAGPDRPVIDFGLRRAQGLGGIHASKASVIGGIQSTSNVYAGRMFDIPASGTQAHAWVQSFSDEYESFEEFAEVYPKKCVLLVDTYDTLQSGVPNAIRTAKKMEEWGDKLFGIRLDSGDHVHFSKESRRMLDEAGLDYVKIVASNELDEYVIEDVLDQGAPIDGFGVGTNLVTGREDAALDGVYKLCKSDGRPRLKLSENEAKIINPDRKNILRFFRDDELFADGIYLESEDPGTVENFYDMADEKKVFAREGCTAKVLLKKRMSRGEIVHRQTSVQEIAESVQQRLALLPEKYKVLREAPPFPVGISKALLTVRKQLIDQAKAKYHKSL